MNKNLLIAFAGALLIAILVALLMSTLLGGGKKKAPRTAEVKTIQILVASKPVAIGQALSSDNMKWKSWPEAAILPGAVIRAGDQKTTDAQKGRAVRPLVAEEPIVASAIVVDDGGFTAARLEPGMRAVAIKANAITTAGGFVRPGDRVDVMLVYDLDIKMKSTDAARKNYMQMVSEMNLDSVGAQTILQNIRVMAVNQSDKTTTTGTDKSSGATAKVKTITLEVDSRGAEKLAVGLKTGSLHLALRSLGDVSVFDEKRSSTTDARMINIDDEIVDQVNQSFGARMYSGGVPVQ